ncbi:hypothetical protein FB451DRAFT_1402300 [Mycena latifolia]|nr:hypothetical protein FB451DRAFT_1402300 [Mycena latifolia]
MFFNLAILPLIASLAGHATTQNLSLPRLRGRSPRDFEGGAQRNPRGAAGAPEAFPASVKSALAASRASTQPDIGVEVLQTLAPILVALTPRLELLTPHPVLDSSSHHKTRAGAPQLRESYFATVPAAVKTVADINGTTNPNPFVS